MRDVVIAYDHAPSQNQFQKGDAITGVCNCAMKRSVSSNNIIAQYI